MQALDQERLEASVVFVSDRRMASLNSEFRGMPGPTDVLAFGETGLEGYQGDVFVSAETAERQARRAGHSLRRECAILVLHGLLHLAGYDHETDRGEMRRLERKMRRHPLFLD